jgi:phosphocarrier protein
MKECNMGESTRRALHARAAARFVEVVEGFDATVEVRHGGLSASGDSIMGLLMLAAARGSTIDVEIAGADAEPLAEALAVLVADRFGEEM